MTEEKTATAQIRTETTGASSTRWIVAAVILALIALGGGVTSLVIHTRNPIAPEDAGKAWAEKLKLPYRGGACTMFDTDDDGYVSCLLALDGPDQVYFQGLQCGEQGSRRAGGCKVDAKNPQTRLVMAVSVDGAGLPAPRAGQ